MPWQHDVAGGQGDLIAASVQSPDFETGVQGWQVRKDGSAEFNDLDIRGTFNGTDFVINSAGAFFYSGTPALGNLVKSITNSTGTDAEGNAYLAGDTSYQLDGGTYQALNINNSQINWFSAATMAGPWTEGSGIDGRDDVFNVGAGTGGSGMQLLVQQDLFRFLDGLKGMDWTPATALVPIIGGSDETWHSLGTAGSTGCTLEQARYRLTVEGECEIDIALVAGSGGSMAGTYTWSNTLPSAYQFTGNYSRAYNMGYVDPVSSGSENPAIAVDGAGTANPGRVRMFLPAFGANTLFTVSQRIPLN